MYGFERAVMMFAMAIVYVIGVFVWLAKGDTERKESDRLERLQQTQPRGQNPPRGQVPAYAQTPPASQAAPRAPSSSYGQTPFRAQK